MCSSKCTPSLIVVKMLLASYSTLLLQRQRPESQSFLRRNNRKSCPRIPRILWNTGVLNRVQKKLLTIPVLNQITNHTFTQFWRFLHWTYSTLCRDWCLYAKKNNNVETFKFITIINPLNPELNPICYLLALLGAHYFLHVSRIRVKLLTFRLLMSYIYGAPILDVSRSHTTTQHSR